MTIQYTEPTVADLAAKEERRSRTHTDKAIERANARIETLVDECVHTDVRVSEGTFHLMHSPFANLK